MRQEDAQGLTAIEGGGNAFGGHSRHRKPALGALPDLAEPALADFAPLILGAGLLALGIQALLLGDFVHGWQPVPAGLPLKQPLAALSAILLIGLSGGLFSATWRSLAAGGLSALLIAWLLVLHVPFIAERLMVLGSWLGAAEVGFILSGALLQTAYIHTARGHHVRTLARALAVLALVNFGACHFVYADLTAAMIPTWIPGRLFWAYATGTGYLAAAAALASGIWARRAAWATAAMMGSFVFLVHVPRIVGTGNGAPAWKLLFATVALAGAASVIAADTRYWNPWRR